MKIGTGWLGWTEQEVLDTSILVIVQAYEGRVDMLKECFGSGDQDQKSTGYVKPTDAKGVRGLMQGLMGRKNAG